MNTFELCNKISNAYLKMMTLALLMVAAILGFFALPQSYQLYIEFPSSVEARMPFHALLLIFTGLVIFFLLLVSYRLGRKIKVDGSLAYFMKRSAAGFGNWTIEKIIDFSRVEVVKGREEKVFMGKTAAIYCWFIFEMKDGKSEEVLVNGWDSEELEKLFHYLRGKFPKLAFNNCILRDSAEKLSGLDELMNKKN